MQTTRVNANENTSDIARRLGVTNAALIAANHSKHFQSDRTGRVFFSALRVGEILNVPVKALQSAPSASGARPAAPLPPGDLGLPFLGNDCGPDAEQIFPGVCVPKGTVAAGKPQGPCGQGFVQANPGALLGQIACIPAPTVMPWGGIGAVPPLPCLPGFTQAGPGLCLPPGTPIGTKQGACSPDEIEVVPGFCVRKDVLGQVTPPGGDNGSIDPSLCKQYGQNYSPYWDKEAGQWTCAACRDDEYLSADGFCMCKPGTQRKDPNDPNSACVGPDAVTGGSGVPGKPTVEECQRAYGPNSWPVWDQANNQFGCNVCGSNEIVDPTDGYCMCRPGFHRQIDGDGTSPCVPDQETQIPSGYTKTSAAHEQDCKSPSIWIEGKGCFSPPQPQPPKDETPTEEKPQGMSNGTKIALGIGAVGVVGLLAILASRSSSSAPAPALAPSGGSQPRQPNPSRGNVMISVGAESSQPRWEDQLGIAVTQWFKERGYKEIGGGTSLKNGDGPPIARVAAWDMDFEVPKSKVGVVVRDFKRAFHAQFSQNGGRMWAYQTKGQGDTAQTVNI